MIISISISISISIGIGRSICITLKIGMRGQENGREVDAEGADGGAGPAEDAGDVPGAFVEEHVAATEVGVGQRA